MTTLPYYAATIRLENDIKCFYKKLYHKKNQLELVVDRYQNRKKAKAFQFNLLFNTALNICFLCFLANWLI